MANWQLATEGSTVFKIDALKQRIMRLLTDITPLSGYRLACTFDNGVEKVADITPYMQSEVFKLLQNPDIFNKVLNRQYYVEWLEGEVDLSADTLWHIGVALQSA